MEKVSDTDRMDLFGFAAPTEQQLSSITIWASRALELQANIDIVEDHLSLLKKELEIIQEVNLPQALTEAGMQEFKLTSGAKITIEDVIQGGLSKDPEKRDVTLDYVIREGGGEIIRDSFEISFAKGRYEEAVALRKLLNDKNVSFDEFEGIHAQTLKSFFRAKIEEGIIPPFEEMGIRYFKRANIKSPKGR